MTISYEATGAPSLQKIVETSESYGTEFNMIRAVQEYGPQRLQVIARRLVDLEKELDQLLSEQKTLEKLLDIVR